MSVLETPRVYFRGQIAWDPITTNNYPTLYDETTSESVFTPTETVQTFREQAIAAVLTNKSWNPDGTHRSVLFETTISGVDHGGGVTLDDPLVGRPVGLTGMLVDLEPYGTFSSQIFFDAMTFGIPGGCQIAAPRMTRFTARYVNFYRNAANAYLAGVASVIWQTSFAKQDLQIRPHESPALLALKAAMADDDVLGLTVQWNAYRTTYFDSLDIPDYLALSKQLVEKLKLGGFQPNPARGVVVGVVGLWRAGEPVHEPGDRALLSTEAATGPTLATAHARLADETLTLDFSNSVSEIDMQLTKQDLGPLTVVAVDPAGAVVATLGTFGYDEYDRGAYDRTSGIITLKVDADAARLARTADLQVRAADGSVLLAEAALRAIPTVPNLYLDEGETATARIQVLDRGVPAGAGVPVTMAASASSVAVTDIQLTGPDGVAAFTVNGVQGQVNGYELLAGADPAVPSDGIDPQVTTYLYTRTLGADAATAALPPTWENVYREVLANWHAMAPCMDNWLRLDDEAQVRAYGAMIKQLTDKANFENYRFMPVTRDMTDGERALLYKFLDAPQPALTATAAPSATSRERLNRAMRGG